MPQAPAARVRVRRVWTVDSEDADGVLGRYGSVCIAVLRAPIDSPLLDRLEETLAAAAETYPDGVYAIIVRAGEAPGSMPGPVRDKARAVLGGHEGRLRGFAYVLRGKGLKARVIRTAMNAVILGASFPGKIFAEHEDALRWLTRLPTQSSEARGAERELVSTVNALLAASP